MLYGDNTHIIVCVCVCLRCRVQWGYWHPPNPPWLYFRVWEAGICSPQAWPLHHNSSAVSGSSHGLTPASPSLFPRPNSSMTWWTTWSPSGLWPTPCPKGTPSSWWGLAAFWEGVAGCCSVFSGVTSELVAVSLGGVPAAAERWGGGGRRVPSQAHWHQVTVTANQPLSSQLLLSQAWSLLSRVVNSMAGCLCCWTCIVSVQTSTLVLSDA